MMTLRQVYTAAGLTLTEADEVTEILESQTGDYLMSTAGYDKLFGYFLDIGEMPYEVAKARTKCPDVWIEEYLQKLS